MADEEGYGKKTGKVPLSFFAVGDSSDSESESEDEEVVQTPMVSRSTDAKVVLPKSKLPSPQTLFATVGRPAFLNSAKDKDADVDWNSLSKRYESSFSSRSQVEYFAPPAPVSLTSAAEDEYDDAVVSSAPVKYKKQATEIQKHMIVHQKRAADIRVLDLQKQDGQSGESEAKKKKVENFQQKEKRKRDLGQASREKSYVEEEKRILRQGFSGE